MKLGQIGMLSSFALLFAALPAGAGTPKVRRGPTAPRLFRVRAASKPRIAQNISPERAAEIQTALIEAGYLSGSPSGTWDASTQAAMEKIQADNGWQTKLVPDARAIIKLGLGPHSGSAANGAVAQSPVSEPESPSAGQHEEVPAFVPAANNR